MARTKRFVEGLNNTQKIRVVINGIGFNTTIKEVVNGLPFETQTEAVMSVLEDLNPQALEAHRTVNVEANGVNVRYDVSVSLVLTEYNPTKAEELAEVA